MVSCRDREDGSLILGSELIEKMFSDEKQVVPGLPIIVLAHHDWRALHPSEQDKFRNKLIQFHDRARTLRADNAPTTALYLCGHNHQVRTDKQSLGDYTMRTFVSGTNINWDPNVGKPDMDVLIGEINEGSENNYVQAYRWEYRRAAWFPDQVFSYDPLQDKALDGRWYFPKRPATEKPIEALKRKYLDTVIRHCGDVELAGITRWQDSYTRSLGQLFVEPVLRKEALPDALKRYQNFGYGGFETGVENHSKNIADFMCGENSTIRAFVHSEPGGGKSTLLRWIACVCAAQKDAPNYPSDTAWGERFFPIWIRCPDMIASLESANNQQNVIELAIQSSLPSDTDGLYAQIEAWLDGRSNEKSVLLLLDGVDETGNGKNQERLLQQLAAFIDGHSQTHFIAALRTRGLDDIFREENNPTKNTEKRPFSPNEWKFFQEIPCYEISPLNDEQMKEFCRKFLKAQDDAHMDEFSILWRLNQIMNSNLRELAKTPLLLTSFLQVQTRRGKLPANQTILLSNALDVMLESSRRDVGGESSRRLNPEDAIPQLAYLAYAMSVGQQSRIDETQLRAYLQDMWATRPELFPVDWTERSLENFVSYLKEDAIILESLEGNEKAAPQFSFRHKTFQDYLAGLAAASFYCPDCDVNDMPGGKLGNCMEQPHLWEVIFWAARISIPCAQTLATKGVDILTHNGAQKSPKEVRIRRMLLRFLADNDIRLYKGTAGQIVNCCLPNDYLMYEDIFSMRKILRGRYREALCSRLENMGIRAHNDPEYWTPLRELLTEDGTPYGNYRNNRNNRDEAQRKNSIAILAEAFWIYSRDEGQCFDFQPLISSDEAKRELMRELLTVAESDKSPSCRWQALRALQYQLARKDWRSLLGAEERFHYLFSIADMMTTGKQFPPCDFLAVVSAAKELTTNSSPLYRTPPAGFYNAVEKFRADYARTDERKMRTQYLDLLTFLLLTVFFHVETTCIGTLFTMASRWREVIWRDDAGNDKVSLRHSQIALALMKIAQADVFAYAEKSAAIREYLYREDLALLSHLDGDAIETRELRNKFDNELQRCHSESFRYYQEMYPKVFQDGAPDRKSLYAYLRSRKAK